MKSSVLPIDLTKGGRDPCCQETGKGGIWVMRSKLGGQALLFAEEIVKKFPRP